MKFSNEFFLMKLSDESFNEILNKIHIWKIKVQKRILKKRNRRKIDVFS